MRKKTSKIQTVLLGASIVLLVIFINSCAIESGGEAGRKEEDRKGTVALEEALMKIEGVGKVTLYFHYDDDGEPESSLSDYFSISSTTGKQADNVRGLLVVAEGAGDIRIKNKLSQILTKVLQLPEHKIVIEEMKKEGEQ